MPALEPDMEVYKEYKKYRSQIATLQKAGDSLSESSFKSLQKMRTTAIQLWNKLTAEQQREVAMMED